MEVLCGVQKYSGYEDGSGDFVEAECRRAYKLGGLVHVCLFQERLEKVAEGLKQSGEDEIR